MDINELRERVRQYLARGPYGSRSEFAKSAGCTPETIDRFLSGGSIQTKTFDRIRDALPQVESDEKPEMPPQTEQDHWNMIADDLENLVRVLRSSIDGDRKAERFAYTVGFYQAEMEAGLAKLKQDRE